MNKVHNILHEIQSFLGCCCCSVRCCISHLSVTSFLGFVPFLTWTKKKNHSIRKVSSLIILNFIWNNLNPNSPFFFFPPPFFFVLVASASHALISGSSTVFVGCNSCRAWDVTRSDPLGISNTVNLMCATRSPAIKAIRILNGVECKKKLFRLQGVHKQTAKLFAYLLGWRFQSRTN